MRHLLEPSGYVVEDRVAMTTETILVEYHETLQTLVLLLLVHVLLGHELFKTCTRHVHVHRAPPVDINQDSLTLECTITAAGRLGKSILGADVLTMTKMT